MMPISFQAVYRFYRDGFCSMRLGKTLWKLVALKLVVLFGVVKLLFFPDVLATRFANDEQRADHVLSRLTAPAPSHQLPLFNGGPRD